MSRATPLALVLLSLVAAPTVAQDLAQEGDRLRITRLDGRVVQGYFQSASDSALVLRPQLGQEAPVIPFADISTVHRDLGRYKKFGRSFGITMVATVAVTMTTVAVFWQPCESFCNTYDDDRISSALFYGGILGTVFGAALGTVVGSSVQYDRLEAVTLPDRVSLAVRPGPGGSFGLFGSLTF